MQLNPVENSEWKTLFICLLLCFTEESLVDLERHEGELTMTQFLFLGQLLL